MIPDIIDDNDCLAVERIPQQKLHSHQGTNLSLVDLSQLFMLQLELSPMLSGC